MSADPQRRRTSATGRYERRALRGAAGRELTTGVEPEPRAIADPMLAWSDQQERSLGDKDAELGRSRAVRRTRRRRVRAAGDGALGDALDEIRSSHVAAFRDAVAQLHAAQERFGPQARRSLSDGAYRRRKVLLAVGDVVGLGLAFSAALDLPLLFAVGMALATAGALVMGASDIGAELKLTLDRERAGTEAVRPRWARILGVAGLLVVVLAASAVGVLRAADGSFAVAFALVILTLVVSWAAAMSAWRHANIAADTVDHHKRAVREAAHALLRSCGRRLGARRGTRRARDMEAIAVAMERADAEAAARRHLAEAARLETRISNPAIFGHGVAEERSADPHTNGRATPAALAMFAPVPAEPDTTR